MLLVTGLVGRDSLALQQDERFAMVRNEIDREKYAVVREHYTSELSDEAFAMIQPLPPSTKPRGRKPTDARIDRVPGRIKINVVKRSDRTVKGFVVLPKPWIIERTLGWLNRSHRLAKDFEAMPETS